MTIDELKAKHAAELAEAKTKYEILESLGLPEGMDVPTVSNIDTKHNKWKAWVSFNGPAYDPEKRYDPVKVVESLEASGWVQLPATLCKWDNYRAAPEVGEADTIPDEKPGSFGSISKLKSAEAIAPVRVIPCQYSQCEIQFYMEKNGIVLKFGVDVPRLASITAKRVDRHGDWSFERGSGRLSFPAAWHSLANCTIHKESRAFVDTEKGVSGAIYFQPHCEQSEWPQTASEFLRELLAAK